MGKTYRQQRDFDRKPKRLDNTKQKRFHSNDMKDLESLYDGDEFDVDNEDFNYINSDSDNS